MLYGTARSKRRSSKRKVARSPAEQERRRAWGRERVRITREKGIFSFRDLPRCERLRNDGEPCHAPAASPPGANQRTCWYHATPEERAEIKQRKHERNVKCGRAAAAPVRRVKAAFDAAERAARQAGENATPPAASASDAAARAAEEALLAELGLEPPSGEE